MRTSIWAGVLDAELSVCMHGKGYTCITTHMQANFKDNLQINALKCHLNIFLKEAYQQMECTELFQISQTPYPVVCSAQQPLCQLAGREQLYHTASHFAALTSRP